VRIFMTRVVAVVAVTGVTLAGAAACSLQPSGQSLTGSAGAGQYPAISAAAAATPAAAIPTVKATFSSAMQAAVSFGSPPAAWQMGILAALQTRHQMPGFSTAMRSDLLAAGNAAIARYFAPPQAATEQQALARALAQDANPNVINLGSGVARVTFAMVRVTGSSAVVSARVTIWTKAVARQPRSGPWQATAPVRAVAYTATLQLGQSGQWQVTKLAGVA
jgi:hypothetical protein